MSRAAGELVDTTDMVVVHRVFRREFRLLPAMVRLVADGDTRRARLVAAHCHELTTALHHHHHGEDEIVWPLLQDRATIEDDLVARMQAQHATVATLLDQVESLTPEWAATAAPTQRVALAGFLTRTSTALDAHLAEEEERVLPLAAEHLTPEEWSTLGERGMASIPRDRLLVFLGHILEEASPQEGAMFLAHVPLPGRIAFHVVGRRRHRSEVTALRRGLPAQPSGD